MQSWHHTPATHPDLIHLLDKRTPQMINETIEEIVGMLASQGVQVKIIEKTRRHFVIFPEPSWENFSRDQSKRIMQILDLFRCANIGYDQTWQRYISFEIQN